MTAALAVATAAATVLAWPRRTDASRRLRTVVTAPPPARPAQPDLARLRPLLAGTAAVAVALATGGFAWVALALPVAVAVARRGGRAAHAGDDLPLVADLLASCLRAGVPVPDALTAAATAASPATQVRCAHVVERLAAGTPPAEAWTDWLADAELAPIARPCVRAATTGATTAREIHRVAARLRARRRARLAQRAQRASIWVVLPLGLCFLPAFVLVGVVPLALGLMSAPR